MTNHTYIQEMAFILKFFHWFFLMKFDTIIVQMELIAHDIPAVLETLPGEAPIVLWSQRSPSGTWDVILTVVGFSHYI